MSDSPFKTELEKNQAKIISFLRNEIEKMRKLNEKDCNDLGKLSGIVIGCVFAFGKQKKILRIPKKHMRRVALDQIISTSIDATSQDLLIHLNPRPTPMANPLEVRRGERCQSMTTNAPSVEKSQNSGTPESTTNQKNAQDAEESPSESSQEASNSKA